MTPNTSDGTAQHSAAPAVDSPGLNATALGAATGATGVATPPITVTSMDGGVFAYGDAPDKGSMDGQPLVAPIVSGDGW